MVGCTRGSCVYLVECELGSVSSAHGAELRNSGSLVGMLKRVAIPCTVVTPGRDAKVKGNPCTAAPCEYRFASQPYASVVPKSVDKLLGPGMPLEVLKYREVRQHEPVPSHVCNATCTMTLTVQLAVQAACCRFLTLALVHTCDAHAERGCLREQHAAQHGHQLLGGLTTWNVAGDIQPGQGQAHQVPSLLQRCEGVHRQAILR